MKTTSRRASGRRRRRGAGFTLIELIAAVAIFGFVAAAAMQVTTNSDFLASSASVTRDLRMLTERKLGEILVFEKHFDESNQEGYFNEYEEFGDRFDEWTWRYEIRDVVVFGVSTQEGAVHLFGEPTDEEIAEAGQPAAGAQPGQPAKKGETQTLREITLRVAAPSDDGVADTAEIIVFAPLVNRKAAAGSSQR